MLRRAVDLFPLWALVLSGVAVALPGPFAALKDLVTPLLGVVMLAMGLTLTGASFRLVLQRPKAVALGVLLQFSLMPLFGKLVAVALRLPPDLATGVVLVGSCPGGTASNVVTYLARGDVALSIALTSATTILAVLATPLLTALYLGAAVDTPAGPMLASVLEVVLLPVAFGATINSYAGARIARIQPWLPLVSVACIVLIIAIIIGLTAPDLARVGPNVVVAAAAHNVAGLLGGYFMARALRLSEAESRTISIEVGMQNSGLGVALATRHFSAVVALPAAAFSIWHNLSGALLAAFWARRAPDPDERTHSVDAIRQ